MEAKEPIVKLIKALLEIDIPLQRQLLIDYMMGRRSRQIEEYGLSDKETYGIGETHDEDFWSMIIDAAYEGGLLKQMVTKNNALIPTAAGKKFSKKPSSFVIPDDESINENEPDVPEIDSLLEQAQKDRTIAGHSVSPLAKQQIKLITAIDRHIALEDFAESEGLGLDEVLDDLEMLAEQKRHLDITYFTDEVLGADCMNELLDYFQNAKSDDMAKALKEYGDTYKEEELRLARIVYRMEKLKAES
jgi:superfamily II DNA helicase RecQ